jgi:hypothetical protein
VGGTAFGRDYPGTDGPRWVVADVLGVAAFEVGDQSPCSSLWKPVILRLGMDGRRFHHFDQVGASAGHRAHRVRPFECGGLFFFANAE